MMEEPFFVDISFYVFSESADPDGRGGKKTGQKRGQIQYCSARYLRHARPGKQRKIDSLARNGNCVHNL
jgi:hypothetical protein